MGKNLQYQCSLCGWRGKSVDAITRHADRDHKQPERAISIDRWAENNTHETEGEYEAGRYYGVRL